MSLTLQSALRWSILIVHYLDSAKCRPFGRTHTIPRPGSNLSFDDHNSFFETKTAIADQLWCDSRLSLSLPCILSRSGHTPFSGCIFPHPVAKDRLE